MKVDVKVDANVDAAHFAVPEKRSLRWFWITIFVVLGLMLAVYLGFAIFFYYHFGFNTKIDGVNVSLKNPEYVESTLVTRAQNYQLRIEVVEEAPYYINANQIDLQYVNDGQIDKLLAEQNIFLWPTWFFRSPVKLTTDVSVRYDSKKLLTIVDNLDFMQIESMKAPIDARIEFVDSGVDSSYRIVPEYFGTTLSIEATKTVISAAVATLDDSLSLFKSGVYQSPTVFATDAKLNEQVELFNEYVPFSITYNFGDKVEVLDGNITINWVDTSVPPTGELSDEALRAWVADFAWRHDTVGHEREVTNPFGEKKRIDQFDYHNGGTYGWLIDREAEVAAIKLAMQNHSGEVREPYYLQRAASFEEQDWGTTFLEVDIAKQHLWYIRDGAVLMESDIVTGLPSGSVRDTPTGVYFLFRKTSPQKMTGEIQANGRPEYEAVVQYCMWFTDEGHAAHDASWQTSFGGDVYTYNGSHGCLNMPPAKAAELYRLIEIDTPVVIHY